MVNSGKEVYLSIELEESISEVEEVVVTLDKKRNSVKNEMAFVSARGYTIEETEKYAGSLGDVARMAVNYSGVTSLSDQQNEIIIRGNSPVGLLWRMNGVDIPNPNHFSEVGSTGGALSIINNNVLLNSDFYTSAFPAKYGNTISGVFDIIMRNGNNQHHENTAQVAFNGIEIGTEGPIKKMQDSIYNPSFVAYFRYSNMELVDKIIGLRKLDVTEIPNYEDLSFKINIPSKKYGTFSIWGIGGKSSIFPNDNVDDTTTWKNKYMGTFVSFSSEMRILALSNKYFPNNRSSMQINLYTTYSKTSFREDTFTIINRIPNFKEEMNNNNVKYGINGDINYKISNKTIFNSGLTADLQRYKYTESKYDKNIKNHY